LAQPNKKTRMLSAEAEAPLVGWLVALNGKHKGTDFRLREGKTAIGSDAGKSDITLEDDFISGQHATLKVAKDGDQRVFILTDLDSANGTFLNDSPERIAREEIVDNDTLTFGQTKMKFKCL
jgi:pSer/pThr/pTyr-binding forkhead associated (FHA) protein